MFYLKESTCKRQEDIEALPLIYDYRTSDNVDDCEPLDITLTTSEEYYQALKTAVSKAHTISQTYDVFMVALHLSNDNRVIGLTYESYPIWEDNFESDFLETFAYRVEGFIGSKKVIAGVMDSFDYTTNRNLSTAFELRYQLASISIQLEDFFLLSESKPSISLYKQGVLR